MRELRINLVMLIAFCAALPVSVLVSVLILSREPMANVYLVLAGAASVALFGLLYALDFLTRCLADVDGASNK
ncbi:MAG: hypothetical protein AB1584_15120 [Pseudomonadota bacterium]